MKFYTKLFIPPQQKQTYNNGRRKTEDGRRKMEEGGRRRGEGEWLLGVRWQTGGGRRRDFLVRNAFCIEIIIG